MSDKTIPEGTEQKINQLQLYEQTLQNFLAQKQQFQIQIAEIESALKELEKTNETYKMVGNILVSSTKEELKKELTSKKETSELRIKTIEKQESQISEKAKKLQTEVMEHLKQK